MKLIFVFLIFISFVFAEQSAEEVCQQPAEAGPCRANMPRFYYDAAQKQCQKFIYGGCGGNENNFKSAEECQDLCANV